MSKLFDQWSITHTDTFGGQANFSWKHEYNFITHESLSRIGVVRRAKAELGWTGVRCDVYTDGSDGFIIEPKDRCEIAFIEWHGYKPDELDSELFSSVD